MKFVDRVTISIAAGDGGRGCQAFTQPPYTRSPYPDGGDGGRGGDVVMLADRNVATLLDFHFRHEFKAKRGGHGGSNNKTGACGEDTTIRVPSGTMIFEAETGLLVRDLSISGESFIAGRGGAGGRGNANALDASPGRLGETRKLVLELKLIADVG